MAYECASVVLKLLLLAGDIEENPGPPTRLSAPEATSDILQALRDLQTGQAALLTEMKCLRTKLAQNDETLGTITERLGKIEIDCASLLSLKNDIKEVQAIATQNSREIASLTARVDDSEDRARRSNLLFFGLKDSANETWAQSEQSAIDVCSENLGVPITPKDIERAHRIGRFTPAKTRPIFVRFANWKDKDRVLSCSKNLRGYPYSISEDFSPGTRLARKKLAEFAKAKNKPTKLRYNKLVIDGVTYVYDEISESVIPRPS
ncbi:uncharacterized protein LOC125759499 [Rhipicephalus sanguineus]|uniref:uncharacterized protein LOC125759499 n=1 Tax=Rhipicephalus sanguineus TaxID=34632 RepID=UPI0020C22E85|nr:uncharacterized protein LOC125759499 [Rhipicephalus sanguineus]